VLMAMRGVMVCWLLGNFCCERGSSVESSVLACCLIGRNSRCQGDCCPCECILVEAFVFAYVSIGIDSIIFLKVAPFLHGALFKFYRIRMLGET